jgi:hopanoid biosynthesis associated radical SAM protein HpnH
MVPLGMAIKVGSYVAKQHLTGVKRYPMVLMLEPLFRCNLACSGCGKIDYPSEILNQRISVADALHAADECGAPIVAIAGGEPLLHREMPQIVEGLIKKGKYVILCTNALLLEKKIDQYKPHKMLCFDIHLDGDKQMHDKSVDQDGVYERAIDAIKLSKSKGFRTSINCTLFEGADPDRVADFLDMIAEMDIEGVMTSPGYAYERAPDQEHFSGKSSSVARRARDAAKSGSSPRARFFSTSWPATKPIPARPGATRRATCSAGSAPAICWVKATPRPTRS